MSQLFRGTLYKPKDLKALLKKFEETESQMFEDFHNILMVDTGRADLADMIEKMNYNIARVQKLGQHKNKDNK